MSLALALPYWLDRPAREALEVAELADSHGFGELWVGEMATFDGFALAGAIARTTTGLSLTIGPLPVTLRDPVALAMGVSSVAELGGRTAHLALGASSATVLNRWHGIDQKASVQRFTEVISVCRALFAGERTDFVGETVRSEGFRLRMGYPGTTITVAAFGPLMLDMAAQLADRVVLAHVSPAQIATVRTMVDTIAARSNRPAPQLVVWTQTGFGLGAVDQVRRGLVSYLGARGYGDMFTEAGFGALVSRARSGTPVRQLAEEIPDDLVHLVAAVGEPEVALHAIEERYHAGADVVVVTPATQSQGGLGQLLSHVASPQR